MKDLADRASNFEVSHPTLKAMVAQATPDRPCRGFTRSVAHSGRKPRAAALVCAVCALLCATGLAESPSGAAPGAQSNRSLRLRTLFHFERNRGQSDSTVAFISRGPGYTLFLTPAGAVIRMVGALPEAAARARAEIAMRMGRMRGRPASRPRRSAVVRVSFDGANPHPRIEGLDQLGGSVNYFVGRDPTRWRTSIPTYARVRYREVWPGIDVDYYGAGETLEYDVVVAAGANPDAVRLAVEGAGLEIDPAGDAVLRSAAGELRLCRLRLFQDDGRGGRRPVGGRFAKESRTAGGAAGQVLTVKTAAYQRSLPLTIDPQLVYSSYLGGSGGTSLAASSVGDEALDIALDSANNVYLTGLAYSTDFPTTVGPGKDPSAPNDTPVVFVAKMNTAQIGEASLIYSTYLGGSGNPASKGGEGDEGHGIAVDGSGDAFVTGFTFSDDFPATARAFQVKNPHGSADTDSAFVAELNPTGSGLVYSTFLGGSGNTEAERVALAPGCASSCQAYAAGETDSADFPTQNPYPAKSARDITNGVGFVSVIGSNGGSLVYSTLLGGSGNSGGGGDGALSVAADASGDAYVTGFTSSKDFPIAGGFQTANKAFGNGEENAFVAKLSPAGGAASLLYSSYLGGSGAPANPGDIGFDIKVDSASPSHAFVTGLATSPDFPVSASAFQRTNRAARRGGMNAFVSEVAADGSSILYSTYLGGSGGPLGVFGEAGSDLALDSGGRVYVTGTSASTDFPTTPAACQTKNRSTRKAFNAFITELNPAAATSADQLVFSSYFGGSISDAGNGVAVDASGHIYATGFAESPDLPVTIGSAFQLTKRAASGNQANAFVVEIDPSSGCARLNVSPGRVSFPKVGVGAQPMVREVLIRNPSTSVLEGNVAGLAPPFSVIDGSGAFSLNPRSTLSARVQFAPLSAGSFQQTLLITSDDPLHQSVPVTVTGAGAAGALSVRKSLSFGRVHIGKSRIAALKLKNTGLGLLTGDIQANDITGAFSVVAGAGPFSLPAGGVHSLIVKFTPVATGLSAAAVIITLNDPTLPAKLIPVSGIGI